MNIEGRTIWQQASGDTNRNYAHICLEWDIILNGPGEEGRWPECVNDIGRSSRKISDLKRFCEEMQDGDIVVLRLGTAYVYGVGEVVGEYDWMHEFSNIDGWDLQHVRRVRWLWKSEGGPEEFETYSLKLGDTTQKVDMESSVVEWLRKLEIPDENYLRDIVSIPRLSRTTITPEEEIAEYLYDRGVASDSIENLVKEFNELRRIAKWYVRFDMHPSEPETIAYLIVPLLRALGWTPQRMAIEWNHVDLALFDKLPRSDDNLSVVVEAKKRGSSCLTAMSQAQSYAEQRPNCKRLIVTEGIRFGIYIRRQDVFSLYAYMDLTEFRDEYPVYRCFGIQEALRAMTPEWNDIDDPIL